MFPLILGAAGLVGLFALGRKPPHNVSDQEVDSLDGEALDNAYTYLMGKRPPNGSSCDFVRGVVKHEIKRQNITSLPQ